MTARPITERSDSSGVGEIFTRKGGGFLSNVVSTVQNCLFPQAMEQQERERLNADAQRLTSAKKLLNKQLPVTRIKTDVIKQPVSEFEKFFKDFFYNLTVKYAEVSGIELIKKAISFGLSELLKINSEEIIENLLVGDPDEHFDLKDSALTDVLDEILGYLFQFCESAEERKQILREGLVKCQRDQMYAEELHDKCTVANIKQKIEEGLVTPFVRILVKSLVPKMLHTQKFADVFSKAVYETVRPFLEETRTMPNNPLKSVEASHLLRVFANIASILIAERLHALYYKLDIKEILDTLIVKFFHHVQAHTQAVISRDKIKRNDPQEHYFSVFSVHQGCHEVTKALMNPTHTSSHLKVKGYLEECSQTIIDFIFTEETVRRFVDNISAHKKQLEEENAGNGLVLQVVEEFCRPERAEFLVNFILSLKSIAVNGLAKGIAEIGKKNFPHNSIYRLLCDILAPPIFDLIRKGIIRGLIAKCLDDKALMSEITRIYIQTEVKKDDFGAITDVIRQKFENMIGPFPSEYLDHNIVPQAIEDLLEVLRKKNVGPGEVKEGLRRYFAMDYQSDGVQAYGDLLMHIVFGISRKGIMHLFEWLNVRRYQFLHKFFRDLFIDGVSHLRGVDNNGNKIEGENPNETLFKLIREAILPYSDPKKIQDLLSSPPKTWDEKEIKDKCRAEAKVLTGLLSDLIRLAPPIGGGSVAIVVELAGLQGHLEVALEELFRYNIVNFNLFYQIMAVLMGQIKKF